MFALCWSQLSFTCTPNSLNNATISFRFNEFLRDPTITMILLMMTPLLSSSRVKFIISQNILGMMWDNRWKLMWNWSCCIYQPRNNNTAILFIVPLASFTHLGISARSLKIGGLNPPRSILFRFSLQCAPPPDDTSHPSIHPPTPGCSTLNIICVYYHRGTQKSGNGTRDWEKSRIRSPLALWRISSSADRHCMYVGR